MRAARFPTHLQNADTFPNILAVPGSDLLNVFTDADRCFPQNRLCTEQNSWCRWFFSHQADVCSRHLSASVLNRYAHATVTAPITPHSPRSIGPSDHINSMVTMVACLPVMVAWHTCHGHDHSILWAIARTVINLPQAISVQLPSTYSCSPFVRLYAVPLHPPCWNISNP